MKNRIETGLNNIGPKIKDFSDKTATSKDWDLYMADISKFANFWQGATKLPENPSSDADAFALLLDIDISIAAMIGLHPDILKIEENIFRKRDYFANNIGTTKILVFQIMRMIIELTNWIDSTKIEVPDFNTRAVRQRFEFFRGEYYGR